MLEFAFRFQAFEFGRGAAGENHHQRPQVDQVLHGSLVEYREQAQWRTVAAKQRHAMVAFEIHFGEQWILREQALHVAGIEAFGLADHVFARGALQRVFEVLGIVAAGP